MLCRLRWRAGRVPVLGARGVAQTAAGLGRPLLGWVQLSKPALRVLHFDASNGVQVHTLDGRHGPVTSLEYAPDGATLAVGARDGVVRLYAIADW
ncbi:WD40 repeat domain-containing protein [Micromonospora sp. NPDC049230]|uniref:WD40 repeat domain-containing protein n=1 Tax=Micromonospora sp. NPDC049230 TaxID=3155502 RepID=UPI0033CC8E22